MLPAASPLAVSYRRVRSFSRALSESPPSTCEDLGRPAAQPYRSLFVTAADTPTCGPTFWCGAGYLFRYNGATWDEAGKLVASDGADSDLFGFTEGGVAISGDMVAVGAHGVDCAAGASCGAVHTSLLNGPDCDDDGTFDL